jgi:hypothetical protein
MTDQANLSVKVELNAGDMYRYSLTTILRRFRFFLLLFAFLTVYLVFQFSRQDFHWSFSFGNVFAPLFFFVVFPYAFFVAPYFSSKKYLENNPSLAGPNSYVFSSDGIDISGVQSNSHLNWAAIQEARETSAQFLLYPQTAVAHVIPKRFLNGSAGEAAMRTLIRANVTKFKLRG